VSRQIASQIKNLPFFYGTTVTPSVSFPSWTPCIGNRLVPLQETWKKGQKKKLTRKKENPSSFPLKLTLGSKKKEKKKKKKESEKKMKKKKKK